MAVGQSQKPAFCGNSSLPSNQNFHFTQLHWYCSHFFFVKQITATRLLSLHKSCRDILSRYLVPLLWKAQYIWPLLWKAWWWQPLFLATLVPSQFCGKLSGSQPCFPPRNLLISTSVPITSLLSSQETCVNALICANPCSFAMCVVFGHCCQTLLSDILSKKDW